MATAPTPIDLDTLREMLASAERMVAYYGQAEQKVAQNAAVIAAGLAPLHSESSFKWDLEQAASRQREVNVLRYLIAYHSGEVFAGEVAA